MTIVKKTGSGGGWEMHLNNQGNFYAGTALACAIQFACHEPDPWPAGYAQAGMGVVVHVSAKKGRAHGTPVIVFRRGDRFVIALTYGRESGWVLSDVVAQGGCELETGGHRLRLTNP